MDFSFGIALRLQIGFGSTVMFTVLTQEIHVYKWSFHFLVTLSIIFFRDLEAPL